jgi:DNA polymerase-4
MNAPATRAIAHVDMDQFYAAVEVLDFPELKGMPVIVGGAKDSRGVVCTASYEARAFGVHSAMASATAARLCPQAVWRAPRMERYAEKSREVHAVFERYTDQIEPLSLDEAFLDLTGSIALFGPAQKIARRIQSEIKAETGLAASVGLAENKFLAKIASDLEKPNGFVVAPSGQVAAARFLAPLPVTRLWGVGPKMGDQLHKYGLISVGQLAASDPQWLTRRIGKDAAEHLLALARGIDTREVERAGRPKSISRENTFASDLYDLEKMERELLALADDVARRLRAQSLRCEAVTLKVRLPDFSRLTRCHTFSEPTDLPEPLYAAAVNLLRNRADLRGRGVRLLGLGATRLVGTSEVSAMLFPDEQAIKRRQVACALDRLRDRFGDDSVTLARLMEGRERTTGTPPDRPDAQLRTPHRDP